MFKELQISYNLFLQKDKFRSFIIIFFSIVLMLLEILSIGILVPLVSMLTMGLETVKNSFLAKI